MTTQTQTDADGYSSKETVFFVGLLLILYGGLAAVLAMPVVVQHYGPWGAVVVVSVPTILIIALLLFEDRITSSE